MSNDKSSLHLVTDADIDAFAHGGGPPYDGGMEARVAKLEDFAIETRDRLTRLETKVDILTETVATKIATKDGVRADIGAAINTQTWRIIGALAALVAAVYFIARYIH